MAATIISSLPLYFAIAFLGLFFCILVAAGYCLDRFVRKNSAHIAYLDTLVDQLKRSEKKAIDAERSKSDFVADISHELRTPLNGIIGMHRLALDGKLSQEQRERIEMADEAAEALLTLVNDILDLSQIEADKFQLEEKTFSVRRLLDSVTTLMSPACLEKGLSLDISIDQDVPQWIKGDKDRLRQILFNIVGNAIKFTDRGGVCVFVTTTRVEGDTISLNIVVEDTGIGMSKETLERLFERYSRANDEASKRIGGAGLGLSISKRLAVAMGGDITVTSEPDVGSAFDIHIKCQESTQPLTSPTQECAPPDFEPLSILVADDNKLNQKIVSELLTRRGHKCNIVANGRDAVAAWRHNAYDVIFMDIHMPNGDGVEASRQIRSSDSPRASVPIIALTASASSKVDALRKSAGIDGFVAKPIEPELLWAELDRCVQKASDSGQKRAIDATVSPTGLPLLDKARLAVLSDIFGEKELYEQLDEVLAESARILREIALALKSGNLNSAKQTAHTLNGMAGNWAATRIGDIARRIESESPTIRRASKYALELYEAVDLTKQAVSQYKNGY
ncbi:MAG: ATP-binding protein [Pseudomonadota bacterium]